MCLTICRIFFITGFPWDAWIITLSFSCSIVLWGIWNVRNKMGIEKRFLSSSNEVFYKFFTFLQKWRILLKDGDARFFGQQYKKNEYVVGRILEAN